MKKIILLLCLLSAFLPLAALDLGLGIDSLSQISGIPGDIPVGFTESLRLSAFLSAMSGRRFSFRLAGFGDYGYSSFAQEANLLGGNLESLELFLLLSPEAAPQRIALKMGRIPGEAGAKALGLSTLDGLDLLLSVAQTDIRLVAGYTGLLRASDAAILLSSDDFLASGDPSIFFAPPRLYYGLDLRFVELLGSADLGLGFSGQADLRQGALDPTNSQYLRLLLSGPLGRGLSYDLSGLLEFIQHSAQAEPSGIAAAASAGIQWYDPARLGSKLNLDIDWASGSGGGLRRYAPIGTSDAGEAYAIPFASMLRLKAAYLLAPTRDFTAALGLTAFMRAGEDTPSDPEYLSTATGVWLGEEGLVSLGWSVLSDLRLNLTAAAFLPAWGITYPETAPLRWKAALGLRLDI